MGIYCLCGLFQELHIHVVASGHTQTCTTFPGRCNRLLFRKYVSAILSCLDRFGSCTRNLYRICFVSTAITRLSGSQAISEDFRFVPPKDCRRPGYHQHCGFPQLTAQTSGVKSEPNKRLHTCPALANATLLGEVEKADLLISQRISEHRGQFEAADSASTSRAWRRPFFAPILT
jgi:hypothetical protein